MLYQIVERWMFGPRIRPSSTFSVLDHCWTLAQRCYERWPTGKYLGLPYKDPTDRTYVMGTWLISLWVSLSACTVCHHFMLWNLWHIILYFHGPDLLAPKVHGLACITQFVFARCTFICFHRFCCCFPVDSAFKLVSCHYLKCRLCVCICARARAHSCVSAYVRDRAFASARWCIFVRVGMRICSCVRAV